MLDGIADQIQALEARKESDPEAFIGAMDARHRRTGADLEAARRLRAWLTEHPSVGPLYQQCCTRADALIAGH